VTVHPSLTLVSIVMVYYVIDDFLEGGTMKCYGGQTSQSCECVCYDGLFAGENCLGTFGLQYTIMCLLVILIWCQIQYNMVKVLLYV